MSVDQANLNARRDNSGNPLVVAVFDNTNPSRGEAMATVFALTTLNAWAWAGRDDKEWVSCGQGSQEHRTRLDFIDLLVLHYNNVRDWEELAQCKPRIVVFYTGGVPGGGTSNGLWIWKVIKDKDHVLEEREASEIISWLISDAFPDGLPPVMLCADTVSMLPALTILCQGYLAVRAGASPGRGQAVAGEKAASERDVVEQNEHKALEKMGWSKVEPSMVPMALQDPEERARLEREVRSPLWWRDALGGGSLTSDSVKALWKREWEAVSRARSEEGWRRVEALLRSCAQTDGVVEPDIVAQAYLTLVDVLEAS